MYMLVEKCTNSHLHLKRSPGIRSWSLCVGIASIGLAAAYYSADSLAWKLFYMAGCFFVAAQNLEQWEEAIFDKNKGTICLKTFNLYKKILTLSKGGNEQAPQPQQCPGCAVSLRAVPSGSARAVRGPCGLSPATAVPGLCGVPAGCPQRQCPGCAGSLRAVPSGSGVRYFGKGHLVVLRFVTGFSHPLTQSAVLGCRSDVEAVAKLITSFLELDRVETPQDFSQSSETEASDADEPQVKY